jgi:hypothetical protein
MKSEKKKVFRSRISVLVVGFILAIFTGSFIIVFESNLFYEMYILGVVFIFIIFIFSGIHYIISEDKFYIKIWMIPYRGLKILEIISVKRSYNPLSSSAASLKRLRIDFKGSNWFMLISPVRENEFIEELQAINPDISIQIPEKKGLCRVQDWDI